MVTGPVVGHVLAAPDTDVVRVELPASDRNRLCRNIAPCTPSKRRD
jgi:hypothetical protein